MDGGNGLGDLDRTNDVVHAARDRLWREPNHGDISLWEAKRDEEVRRLSAAGMSPSGIAAALEIPMDDVEGALTSP